MSSPLSCHIYSNWQQKFPGWLAIGGPDLGACLVILSVIESKNDRQNEEGEGAEWWIYWSSTWSMLTGHNLHVSLFHCILHLGWSASLDILWTSVNLAVASTRVQIYRPNNNDILSACTFDIPIYQRQKCLPLAW